jgi:amino acid transporter
MMNDIKYDDKARTGHEKSTDLSSEGYEIHRNETNEIGDVADAGQLQRHLGNRQVQLIAIGGSIGTATFVSIANGLIKGGPGSLLLAYTLYTCILGLVNNSMAEMASFSVSRSSPSYKLVC